MMTELEHAEYRMLMRAGVRPAEVPVESYYLVGFVHGVRRGESSATHDALVRTIRRHDRTAVLHDPLTSYRSGADAADELHMQSVLAAASTVCVAWLPDQERISDAAVELQAAHGGGSTVVAITGHRDHLLVRAFASAILPDVTAFGEWLAGRPRDLAA